MKTDTRALGIICKNCGEFLISRHRHDFKLCKCGKVGIDGGQSDYIKITGNYSDFLWAKEKTSKEK